jgi:hypothetical protein
MARIESISVFGTIDPHPTDMMSYSSFGWFEYSFDSYRKIINHITSNNSIFYMMLPSNVENGIVGYIEGQDAENVGDLVKFN